MNNLQPTDNSHRDGAGAQAPRSRLRVRGLTVALLLVLSLIAPACTPGQIETSMERIAISFEQGGVERGLFEAVLVVNNAIPEVGMLIGYAIGP